MSASQENIGKTWCSITILLLLVMKRTVERRTTNKPKNVNTAAAVLGELQCIRSENGGEFQLNALKGLLRNKNIYHELTAPYFHQTNGCAEQS